MALTIDFEQIEQVVNEAFQHAQKLSPKQKSKIAKWTKAKSGRLIRKAAEILADKGRAIGSLQGRGGALCVRGAVNYAWCGNARITEGYLVLSGENSPEPILSMAHFGEFLAENDLINPVMPVGLPLSVESWNDNTKDTDEVIRWMHKFADEVDPQK